MADTLRCKLAFARACAVPVTVEDLQCAIALLDTHAVGGMFGPKEEAYALVADWLQREVDRRVAPANCANNEEAPVTDLTPDDLARLRVPLSDLPGLPCRGLLLYPMEGSVHDGPLLAETDIRPDDMGRPVVRVCGGMRLTEFWAVDLSDGATRDRCARWLAGRVGLGVGSTAPRWEPVWTPATDRAWYLGGRGGTIDWFAGPSYPLTHTTSRAPVPVSALDDLDPSDDRRIPDGSRWVDAAALAAVLRGTP